MKKRAKGNPYRANGMEIDVVPPALAGSLAEDVTKRPPNVTDMPLLLLIHHRRTGQGGREGSCPLGFEKLVKFGQMRWEIRAFRELNFSR